ncbi:hypothetical protein FACS189413_07510 [Bacteroidia bacterium]|nr:hypothetical protein FACS189413_07510 [Bacteroidia bacterium]
MQELQQLQQAQHKLTEQEINFLNAIKDLQEKKDNYDQHYNDGVSLENLQIDRENLRQQYTRVVQTCCAIENIAVEG